MPHNVVCSSRHYAQCSAQNKSALKSMLDLDASALESEVAPDDPFTPVSEAAPDETALLCASSPEKVDRSCNCSVWRTLLIVSCVVLGIVLLVIVGCYTVRRLSKSGEGISPLF